MSEPFELLTRAELLLAIPTFISLLFIRAPYGRHARAGWGPTMPARWGWLIMEFPALFGFIGWYLVGSHRFEVAPAVVAGFWVLHYGHRTLVFPTRMTSARPMPVSVVAMGAAFNVLNSYVNGRSVSAFHAPDMNWLSDPRFVLGALIFLAGFAMNLDADRRLLRLKATGEYQIPTGGPFRFVSCPNYLGEIIEWTGFAILAWSLPALAFCVYTIANLAPRALSHHRWYRDRFESYPPDRRALIPFIL